MLEAGGIAEIDLVLFSAVRLLRCCCRAGVMVATYQFDPKATPASAAIGPLLSGLLLFALRQALVIDLVQRFMA